jgi:hypothetical protein
MDEEVTEKERLIIISRCEKRVINLWNMMLVPIRWIHIGGTEMSLYMWIPVS